jgi:hypothetical protein
MDDEGIIGVASVSATGAVEIEGADGVSVTHDPVAQPGKYVVAAPGANGIIVQLKHPDARIQLQKRMSDGTYMIRVVAARSPSEPFNSPLEIAVLRGA